MRAINRLILLALSTTSLVACGGKPAAKAPIAVVDPCTAGLHASGVTVQAGTWDAVAVAATLQSPLRDRVSSVVVANDRIRLTLRGDDEESDGQTGQDQTGDRQSTDGQSTDLAGTAGEVDESGGLVYWGTVEDSELKAKVLAGLLVGGGDYKFFDVATPGYPTAGPSVPDATARVMGLPQDSGQSTSGSSETSEATDPAGYRSPGLIRAPGPISRTRPPAPSRDPRWRRRGR